jgi:hypothetical protein
MRRLVLVALAACGADARTPQAATWTLNGDRSGPRSAERVTCTVALDPDDPLATVPFFTLSIITKTDDGLHVVVPGFTGAGTYTSGTALVNDGASLLDCSRDSLRCYRVASGCSVAVDAWSLPDTLPGARAGAGHGTVTCAGLENLDKKSLRIAGGEFTCRATDWTPR